MLPPEVRWGTRAVAPYWPEESDDATSQLYLCPTTRKMKRKPSRCTTAGVGLDLRSAIRGMAIFPRDQWMYIIDNDVLIA